MNVVDLVADLRRRGVIFSIATDGLKVRGVSTLKPAELDLIRDHKSAIVAVLTAATNAREPSPPKLSGYVQCQACTHAGHYSHSPFMVRCAKGWGRVNSLNARWKTDWIQCPDYSEKLSTSELSTGAKLSTSELSTGKLSTGDLSTGRNHEGN